MSERAYIQPRVFVGTLYYANPNEETLLADKILLPIDSPIQKLNPGVSDYKVILPEASYCIGVIFTIYNSADAATGNLIVRNPSDTETLATIYSGFSSQFICFSEWSPLLYQENDSNVVTGSIYTHMANTSIHAAINDNSTSLTDLWSANKIYSHTSNEVIHREINDNSISTIECWSAYKLSQHTLNCDIHRVINDNGAELFELWSAFKIASHTCDETIHRMINDSGTSSTDLWSAEKIASVIDQSCQMFIQTQAGCDALTAVNMRSHMCNVDLHRTINDDGSNSTDLWSAEKIIEAIAGSLQINDSGTSSTDLWSAHKIATTINESCHINDFGSSTTDLWSASKIASVIDESCLINDSGTSYTDIWSAHKIAAEIDGACQINDSGTTSTDLWSAYKIYTEIQNNSGGSSIQINDSGTGIDEVWSASKIYSHTSNSSIHRTINDSGTGTTDLWSASKISAMIGGGSTPTEPITVNTHSIFESSDVQFISTVYLDSTHIVIAYQDIGNNEYGTAIVGTISGTNINFGSPIVFSSFSTWYIGITTLDSTHIVITYMDNDNNNYGTSIVGTVSGSTINFGSPIIFNSDYSLNSSLTTIDSTHIAIVYQDVNNSQYGTSIVGTVSGSTISYGSPVVFNSNITFDFSITTLDSTHIFISYQDRGNNNYGTAIVGTISGTTISFGSPVIFESNEVDWASSSTINSTHAIISYQKYDSNAYGTTIIGTVSGTSISFGSADIFENDDTYDISNTVLDSTHVLITYRNHDNNDYGTTRLGTISGNSVSCSAPVIFEAAGTFGMWFACTSLNSSNAVVAYSDHGNNNYGTSVVLTVT